MRPTAAAVVASIMLIVLSPAVAQSITGKNSVVNYQNIDEAQARSIADVVDAARQAAIARFGFELPEKMTVTVTADPSGQPRLFTDGVDQLNLHVRSSKDLRKPKETAVFHLYGLCHEIGHIAMYRLIPKHDYLTTAATEGWAHYFGSVVVDEVFAAQGEKLWWDPYDYREDGTKRLSRQIDRGGDDPTVTGAALWRDLARIIGDKSLPVLFAKWGKATIDPGNPSPALYKALLEVANNSKVAAWWLRAEPVLIRKRPLSDFAPATNPAKPASGKTTELALDDGKSAGKSSIAGSGHAVLFESPSENAALTAVKIFGSCYGAQQPPAEEFHLFLCDDDGKQIKDFTFPYKLFLKGEAHWVTLKIDPIQIPKRFILGAAFNPTASKGVFVHHDAAADGDSRTGLPGNFNEAFGKGDWMIRAIVTE